MNVILHSELRFLLCILMFRIFPPLWKFSNVCMIMLNKYTIDKLCIDTKRIFISYYLTHTKTIECQYTITPSLLRIVSLCINMFIR